MGCGTSSCKQADAAPTEESATLEPVRIAPPARDQRDSKSSSRRQQEAPSSPTRAQVNIASDDNSTTFSPLGARVGSPIYQSDENSSRAPARPPYKESSFPSAQADPGYVSTTSQSTLPPSVLGPAGPVESADNRKLVLIVWDIENVRLPINEPALPPWQVISYIKTHYIQRHGRTEYRTVAAMTLNSLQRIREYHPRFIDEMVPHMRLLLASTHEKRNADVVLKTELSEFMVTYSHIARSRPQQLTIVLITGDADFRVPVQEAIQAGFAVELLHHDSVAPDLRNQMYTSPPRRWIDFLREASQLPTVTLPYPEDNGSPYRNINNNVHRYATQPGFPRHDASPPPSPPLPPQPPPPPQYMSTNTATTNASCSNGTEALDQGSENGSGNGNGSNGRSNNGGNNNGGNGGQKARRGRSRGRPKKNMVVPSSS